MTGFLGAYPGLLPGFVLTAVIAILGRRRVGRWLDLPPMVASALLVAVGLVLSATLTPSPDALTGQVAGTAGCDLSRVGPATGSQLMRMGSIALNVILFVPVGAVIALVSASRFRLPIVLGAVGLPVAIELIQLVAVSIGRECQSGDVIDNMTGIALGACATAAARWVLDARRRPARIAIRRLFVVAAGVGALLAAVVLQPGGIATTSPSAVPTFSPQPVRTTEPHPGDGRAVRVTSVPGLLDALADDTVSDIEVADGTYRISTAASREPDSLWIGERFAGRTRPVTIRAATIGGAIFDGDGADFFGGITFVEGAHHQTWDGFVFANGSPTQTGVVVFGGYPGLAAPHHITMRNIIIPRSITSEAEGAVDHAFYLARAVGGPHDLLFEDITVDGGGGLSSAFHVFGSDAENPNAWNVTVRRLQVSGTQQAIILWDETIHDITFDTVTVTQAGDYAVRFESRGATDIVFKNVVSTGSGSGTGFQSNLGQNPPGVTMSNNSFR